MSKTIFITVFHGLVARVLNDDVLRRFSQKGVRVVVLVQDFKREYFSHLFKNYKNIVVEGIDFGCLPARAHFFHKLSFLLLHTKTMRLKRRSARDFESWPKYFANQGVAVLFGRWKVVRSLFRWLNAHFSGGPVLAKYFDKYRPSLVVAMDIKHIVDARFVLEARWRGVKTLGMVRSWDYLTAKGVIMAKPDRMIVHNKIIKNEAIRYADMESRDIEVIGIPHFDPYVNTTRESRKNFFGKIGFAEDRRLIFFGSVGKKFGATDDQIFEMIDKAIHNRQLPSNLVVLVRLPPSDSLAKEVSCCAEHFVFEYPGVNFSGHGRKENEMSLEDLTHLADSIYHSDVVITGPSTICIDAAVFDKPIICLGFEGYQERPYFEGIIHRYDFDHMQHFMRTGAGELAHSETEFISMINRALEHPGERQKNRKQLVREQCYKLDGKSSQRLAESILRSL